MGVLFMWDVPYGFVLNLSAWFLGGYDPKSPMSNGIGYIMPHSTLRRHLVKNIKGW